MQDTQSEAERQYRRQPSHLDASRSQSVATSSTCIKKSKTDPEVVICRKFSLLTIVSLTIATPQVIWLLYELITGQKMNVNFAAVAMTLTAAQPLIDCSLIIYMDRPIRNKILAWLGRKASPLERSVSSEREKKVQELCRTVLTRPLLTQRLTFDRYNTFNQRKKHPAAKMSDDEDNDLDQFEDAQDSPNSSPTLNVDDPFPHIPHKRLSTVSSMASEDFAKDLPSFDKKAIKALLENADETLDNDIRDVELGTEYFLNSRFDDAESLFLAKYLSSMYCTHAYAIISVLKARIHDSGCHSLMTFEPADLDKAFKSLKASVYISSQIRAKQSILSQMSSMVGGLDKEASRIAGLTRLQKHAELNFAEAYLLKALLSILSDSSMVALVREGLHIKNAYGIFQACYRFVENVLEEAETSGKDADAALAQAGVDEHFLTGVLHGVGMFEMIFSLLPGRILRIFEMIGFTGDREFAISRLEIGGGWPVHDRSIKGTSGRKASKAASSGRRQTIFKIPKVATSTSGGIRKFICDLNLLAYHVLIPALLPLPDIDLAFAREILDAQLQKHPTSFIFLLLSGLYEKILARPAITASRLEQVQQYGAEWKQLIDITYWEMGIAKAIMLDWSGAANCYAHLYAVNKWSKAVYRFQQAACMYQADAEKYKTQVDTMMKEIAKLTKKVAGKSIPVEKFFARKSRKWTLQGGRLLLPGLECLYIWNGFDFMPKEHLYQALDLINDALRKLDSQLPPSADQDKPPYETYFDDLCLARFFKGVVMRELAMPTSVTLIPMVEEAKLRPNTEQVNDLKDAARALDFIKVVAPRIHLDHYILPFSRYEHGRLAMRMGDYGKARIEFQAALNGGFADDEDSSGWRAGSRKYSLEGSIQIRTHNALAKLEILEKTIS
ncbi:hypothetical protein SmJEL517_g00442 [Synchytrium microbalum]|uniref:Uncharacterized protein n=1 Tax=Synchytrium microbalum TaxID=1806994 RepID=A0A507CJ62_9FUNG|nr:uncharacterized protein SmJEL517_g00442 [Synchytrium microbalum]TPX37753.1 hypothetical protein SmJEL517_g00442 [Synchytrium microbalum]